MSYISVLMIFDESRIASVQSVTTSGALPDVSDIERNDALALAAGVVGAGVLGTGLVIGTYAAPIPMIGGALLATGLGVAAGTLDSEPKAEAPVQVTAEAPAA